MKLFTRAKSVSLSEVLSSMFGVVLPKRKNSLIPCPICGNGTNTPCFGLYGKSKGTLDKFKCFSCGIQGDSIAFVKHSYGLATDADAASEICRHFNIPYDEPNPVSEEYTNYVKTYNYVANLFASCYKSTYNSDPEYFQNRGLTKETIEKYQLGYCPTIFFLTNGKHITFRDLLIKVNMPLVDGLYNEDSGECVFAGRYIFPIRNSKGDVIAFSGRSLDENVAKYVNTCDTPFFHKSNALFNYNVAKAYSTVYVVEGYMDALSLIDNGIPNVVAAMGTAFTDNHLSLLKGKDIILSLDHDGAGLKHTLNIILNHRDTLFKILYTPKEYKDFNEMYMACQSITNYIKGFKFKTGPEFVIRALTHIGDMSNLEVRSDIWRKLASLIGTFQPQYIRKYPLNTLYTPVDISYYWKIYARFIKKNTPIKKDASEKGGV